MEQQLRDLLYATDQARTALALLDIYPGNAELLKLIGNNWLSRAQPPLARNHLAERNSCSSGESIHAAENLAEAEDRVQSADYVDAHGILLPATEYLQRAVESASRGQSVTGHLLSTKYQANTLPSYLQQYLVEYGLLYGVAN
ncbi:hypothetical protein GQ43DRAFT_432532 [Delitschia confertaspora ATCC 74209]|uniref:Uncharacterized protein n=1 Tax=Delitschia confertaspora ATCC 74209 TaxID=1513339 RepID=A0A9P4JLE1_9PLEO|nr:hypothetical protein GQ43DRAFT_432532 [Delitschia confertaspora ATCC 74209]